uniref:Long-chain acyl-CoA synthetase n=1 Tax=Candidatus Kentrum eta TaxID=2126337 RepID=A0A450VBU9_9GAMM|nr:MAG: long-chain acyl-CoA synthetase [Candidatus Kentron sp. H]VFJ94091.1 MAG: long-chain acyl-CoA synthetase [Candidatus Kentron sp. H]VFK02282.1 MAG: long-chain acyl-CoA synthetase [Candidatus Kentron sp. H]
MTSPAPSPNPEHNTLPKLLRMWADRAPDAVALREKDFGIWHELTWRGYRDRVAELAVALSARGFGKDDVIGLMGNNEIWLACAEVATHAAGCMSLGIYRDTLEEEVGYLATYTDVSAVFAEDQEQVDKFLNLSDRLPKLRLIFHSEPRGLRHTGDERIIDIRALAAEGRAILAESPGRFDERVDAVRGSDVAILCTTSGTTSNPKLAMLTGERFIDHVTRYLEVDPKTPDDEYVSVLPFPWIMEQVYALGFNLISGMKVNFPESQETAMADLREIGPTFMLGAPRLWEQLAADMRARIMDASKLNQWIFNTLIQRGTAAIDRGRRSRLADIFLFSALRDRFGFSRVRSAATGGAALGPDTFKLFLAMGIPLRQLYGQTELIGAYTLQAPPGAEMDCDSVGLPFRGVQVVIREPDQNGVGEIVTRHPNLFVGYYKNRETYEADMRDGWMHSGDAGYFDKAGRLVIIDRMKDIAIKADGSKFSPQYIENKSKFSPFIGESVVLGAGRDYLTAMVCIRFSIVAKWAEKRRIPYTSYTNLAANPAVYELIRDELGRVNKTLVAGQRIRKFLLLFKELDPDDGELTRTRKLRRALIHERYGEIIDAFYRDAPVAHIDTQVTYEDGRRGRIQADMEIWEIG